MNPSRMVGPYSANPTWVPQISNRVLPHGFMQPPMAPLNGWRQVYPNPSPYQSPLPPLQPNFNSANFSGCCCVNCCPCFLTPGQPGQTQIIGNTFAISHRREDLKRRTRAAPRQLETTAAGPYTRPEKRLKSDNRNDGTRRILFRPMPLKMSRDGKIYEALDYTLPGIKSLDEGNEDDQEVAQTLFKEVPLTTKFPCVMNVYIRSLWVHESVAKMRMEQERELILKMEGNEGEPGADGNSETIHQPEPINHLTGGGHWC